MPRGAHWIGKRNVTSLKHGHTSSQGGRIKVSRTYKSWDSMKQRCLNPNAPNYDRYGGRGISIWSKWLGRDGFAAFLADMGERPFGKTIGRRDNDGDYSPDNCQWEDDFQQARNRRASRLGAHPNSRANLTHRGTRESALKAWVTRRAKLASR